MNRKRVTLLSIIAAVLMAAALMGSLWFAYFSGGTDSFDIPPPGAPDSPPGTSLPEPSPGGQSLKPLTVDAGNVQALLGSVERPAAYSQTVESVTYWPGGKKTATHHLARRNDLTRLETLTQPAQNLLATPDTTYVWTGGTPVIHEVSPEDADAEALAGIRAWEEIISLPAESVVLAELVYQPERILRVLTQEPIYRGEYAVSLETGLLISASFTDADGNLAYEVKAKGPPILGDPGDDWFTLPDGRVVS